MSQQWAASDAVVMWKNIMKDKHRQFLETMKPNQWYYTLGKFEKNIEPLVKSGILEKKLGPIGPAYRKIKKQNAKV